MNTLVSLKSLESFVLPARPRQSRQWQALGSALGIEAAVVGLFIAWMATHPPQQPETVIPLTLELPPVTAQRQEKPPEPTVHPTLPTAKQPPRTALPQPSARQASPATSPAPDLPTTPTPTQIPAPSLPVTAMAPSHPPAAPPPAPVQPPPAPAVDLAAAYNAKLAAAVQAAFEVPAAAEALGFKGRTRVEFSLRDGAVAGIRVVQTSGLGAADRAAVKAVQSANYPPPPAGLPSKDASYQIWVACL